MSETVETVDFQPQTATVALTPDATALIRVAQGALSVAAAYEITDAEMASEAVLEVERLSKAEKKLEEARVSITKPARQVVDNANAFFKPFITHLQDAQKVIKGRLLTWHQEQQRLADEARRKAEEAAAAARRRAEEEAAAARAKAEAEAKAARDAAEEALRRADELAAEGKAKESAKIAGEAAKLAQRAESVVEAGEAKAQEAVITATAAVPTAAAPAKVSGFSARDNWVAELAPGMMSDASAIAQIAAAIVGGRSELLAYLALDWQALRSAAKAQKEHMNVPGIKAKNVQVAARTRR